MKVEKNFPFVYDLAEEWIEFSKLPFVFAAWVTNKNIGQTFQEKFNEALDFGINNLDAAIKATDLSYLPSYIDPKTYLTENIDFILDNKKRDGLDLFLNYAAKLTL